MRVKRAATLDDNVRFFPLFRPPPPNTYIVNLNFRSNKRRKKKKVKRKNEKEPAIKR